MFAYILQLSMLMLLHPYKFGIAGSSESLGILHVAFKMSWTWSEQRQQAKRRRTLDREVARENQNVRTQQATIDRLQDGITKHKTELREALLSRGNETRAYFLKRRTDKEMLKDLQIQLDNDEDLEIASKKHFATFRIGLQDRMTTLKTRIQQAKKSQAASRVASEAASEALANCDTDRPWRRTLSPEPPSAPPPQRFLANRGYSPSHRPSMPSSPCPSAAPSDDSDEEEPSEGPESRHY